MEQQSLQAGDLVCVIYLHDAHYRPPFRPGIIGTVLRHNASPVGYVEDGATYWDVSFPDIGTHTVNQRVLRKIDGEGRKVGRWDFCVFNAPKRAREIVRLQEYTHRDADWKSATEHH